MIFALMTMLLAPRVDPALREPWIEAALAWGPANLARIATRVKRVEICADDFACFNTGGGAFDQGVVMIDLNDADVIAGGRRAVVLVLEHEIGHALGLDHYAGDREPSIMKPGWRPPLAERPSAEDLRKVEEK